MNNNPWTHEEFKFVKANSHKGIDWLIDNIDEVSGNRRTKYSIQRIAYIKGYKIKKIYKQPKIKAPRKPALALISTDDQAMENVKFSRLNLWPVQLGT